MGVVWGVREGAPILKEIRPLSAGRAHPVPDTRAHLSAPGARGFIARAGERMYTGPGAAGAQQPTRLLFTYAMPSRGDAILDRLTSGRAMQCRLSSWGSLYQDEMGMACSG